MKSSSDISMNAPIIAISNISHEYPGRRALDDVSLQVSKGEVFGFLGPNGGGKTTMFKILSTTIVPTNGRAEVCGFDVVIDSSEVRKHIGVVFQSASLDIKLTVKENLRFQGLLQGLHGAAAAKRIDDVLRHLKLEDRKNDIVEKLSGGLQRRVEIGKGLLHRPDVLILDEPIRGLIPAPGRICGRIYFNFAPIQASLLSSHPISSRKLNTAIGLRFLIRGLWSPLGRPRY